MLCSFQVHCQLSVIIAFIIIFRFGTVEDKLGPTLCRKLHSIGWVVTHISLVRNDVRNITFCLIAPKIMYFKKNIWGFHGIHLHILIHQTGVFMRFTLNSLKAISNSLAWFVAIFCLYHGHHCGSYWDLPSLDRWDKVRMMMMVVIVTFVVLLLKWFYSRPCSFFRVSLREVLLCVRLFNHHIIPNVHIILGLFFLSTSLHMQYVFVWNESYLCNS